MAIWSGEIKDLEELFTSLKGPYPELEKELGQLIKTDDANVVMLYSRRCLEVIITDLCECELNRPRKTEPLKGIIDKLNKEEKVPAHIITSMDHVNSLSIYGAHPKKFNPEQVKPVLNNLNTIIKWFYEHKNIEFKSDAERKEDKSLFINEKRTFSHPDYQANYENSIAVLPFVNMSNDPDQEYFCDGMTEEIINALTHIEKLKVIARTSAFVFKDKYIDIREIGKELNVETLLEGSIRKADNRLRITVQLVKADDGSHLWSEKFDREQEDVFAIQDEISLAIADKLKIQLLGEEKAAIVKRNTENLEAYNLYLKGNYYCQMLTDEGFKNASGYYKRSLQLDPKYALAYVGLATVYWYSSYWGNMPPNEAYPKANEYINKALEIDNTLAEANSLLGMINFNYYWHWKKAELNFKQALRINPNSALIHIYYSFLLTCTENHEKAISEAKRAQELDPLSGYINSNVGTVYNWAGQYDRAIEACKKSISLNPNYYLAHYQLGFAYRGKSLLKEAFAEFKKAFELSEGIPLLVSVLAGFYNHIGNKDQAKKLLDNLLKRSRTEYVPATCLYLIYRNLNEPELAFKWLEQAFKDRDSFIPWFKVIPIDILRIPDEPRYKTLLKTWGLE